MTEQIQRLNRTYTDRLSKIPKDAQLIAEFKKPINSEHKELVDHVKVYSAYKSHGYQTEYNKVSCYLVAMLHDYKIYCPVALVKKWTVKELRGKNKDTMVNQFIESCIKYNMERIV